ncbi:hypothetical protein BU17DRAFT_41726 [Hysterangium stoloniferum]|nr:hypothetical protein BU17DRAFT_41726 [Hysterangium stoloniferum]
MDKTSFFFSKVGIVTADQRLPRNRLRAIAFFGFLTCFLSVFVFSRSGAQYSASIPNYEQEAILERCRNLNVVPRGFAAHLRAESDRFVPGTKPTLLRNAKIWTGGLNGTEGTCLVIYGDLLLDKGLIKAIGYIPTRLLKSFDKQQLHIQDLQGAWVTPGLVDLHSHIGVGSVPHLEGASDTNSVKAPILPWLRSLDGLNTHDESYTLAIAGGVTTAQVLPGSANNIAGGQAFVIKLRPTAERSAISKVIEPPHTLSGTNFDPSLPPRWRHMKHACGENPSRTYSMTRMDSAWKFREAYNEARKIKDAQDEFCAVAEAGKWKRLGKWPEDLQWESLVDVLRGRVKLSVHCYEPVDFDGIVRLTNEFKFPVASFHHAGSAYLVPDLLKKTYGGTPSIALFASNFRKKREAYRGSEFGPRVLADNGIPVVMKSDHPVVNSRYLLNEAALAFYHGLAPNLALASVTSVPAQAAGLGHRIGSIQQGQFVYIAVWDSYPLSLGATPSQVFIDGIMQFETPYVSPKPGTFQQVPTTPNFDKDAEQAVKFEGLPPLEPRKAGEILFTGVKDIWTLYDGEVINTLHANVTDGRFGSVLVRDGRIACVANPGREYDCISADNLHGVETIDLDGGAIAPGLTTFGTDLGISEIRLEASTGDGSVFDPLRQSIPAILGEADTLISAVDGLQFETRNALLAYRSGVTLAVTAPTGGGFWKGLSVAFNLGAKHALQPGAVVQKVVALHVSISKGATASVSTQIAALRKLLLESKYGTAFSATAQGELSLIVNVDSADIMATLIRLKEEVEDNTGKRLRLTFAGATEAWLLAAEISKANVGVILYPSRSFPGTWDKRRFLAGPPLTFDTPLTTLFEHNVTVALGVENEYDARNTRFDIAWASLESNGRIGKTAALSLALSNLERLLGVSVPRGQREFVAWRGGDPFEMSSRAVTVFSEQRGTHLLY